MLFSSSIKEMHGSWKWARAGLGSWVGVALTIYAKSHDGCDKLTDKPESSNDNSSQCNRRKGIFVGFVSWIFLTSTWCVKVERWVSKYKFDLYGFKKAHHSADEGYRKSKIFQGNLRIRECLYGIRKGIGVWIYE